MSCICTDLQKFTDRVNESLIMVVAHTFNLSVMRCDAIVQQINKLWKLIIIIHSPAYRYNQGVRSIMIAKLR